MAQHNYGEADEELAVTTGGAALPKVRQTVQFLTIIYIRFTLPRSGRFGRSTTTETEIADEIRPTSVSSFEKYLWKDHERWWVLSLLLRLVVLQPIGFKQDGLIRTPI